MSRRFDDTTGWVSDEGGRRRYEESVQRLVGRTIERVRYVELRYEGRPEPMWPGQNLDSLDYGLELDLDDRVTWAVVWNQAGHNEALLVYPGTLSSQLRPNAGTTTWDVTQRWHDLGPRDIRAVAPVWTRHGYGAGFNHAGERVSEPGQSDLCLVTLLIESDAGRQAIITLGETSPGGGYWYVADNVAVFFSAAAARQARVLLPGDPTAVT